MSFSGVSNFGANPYEAQQLQQQQRQQAIKDRYNEIYAHESAHLSALGPYAASGIQIEFAGGVPVGGHVQVAMPKLDAANPENTMKAAQQIKFAAGAPEDPSSQDRNVAAQAQALYGQAQVLLQQKKGI